MRMIKVVQFAAAVSVAALTLAGCSALPEEKPKQRESSVESGEKSKRPAGEDAERGEDAAAKKAQKPAARTTPPKLPECQDLVSDAQAAQILGVSSMTLYPSSGRSPNHGRLQGSANHGPSAQQAWASSADHLLCDWTADGAGTPMGFSVVELSDAAQATFLAELRASDYAEGSVAGIPSFSYTVPATGAVVEFAFVGPFVAESTSNAPRLFPALVPALQAL